MNIIGPIAGLAVMVMLIPLLGLMILIILGALVGGLIGFIINLMRNKNSPPVNNLPTSMAAGTDTDRLALIDVGKRLAKIKRIRVQGGSPYLADIVVRIEGGDARAHWILGECFLRGNVLPIVFPVDKKSALFWFRKSAELGLASSQYELGVIYLGYAAWKLGIGYSEESALEKNLDEAVKWLGQAANQSDHFAALAQDVLGELYFLGIGVSQDHAQAFDLFSRSLANPNNMNVKMGSPTRAWNRLPMLKDEGYT